MSEVKEMTPKGAAPAAPAGAPVVTAPGKPLNAIQIIEQEIANFSRQREQHMMSVQQAQANVHAAEGAIQGAQHLLVRLRAEAAKAEAEAKKLADEVKTDVVEAVAAVEGGAKEVVAAVEKAL